MERGGKTKTQEGKTRLPEEAEVLGRGLSLFLNQREKKVITERKEVKKEEGRERRSSDYRRKVRTGCLCFYFETKSEDSC